MLTKKEEFYAARRSKRHKPTTMEPYAQMEYIRKEREYRESYPPDPAKEALVKSAIENFVVKLRIDKIKVDYQRNNKVLMFHSKRRWVVMTWCAFGYITIKSNIENPYEISFRVSDYRDIIEKMVRYQVVYSGD